MTYLKFCQACEFAIVSVPEDDKVLLLLPHALEPVHLPHPVVSDPLEDEQGCKFISCQGHLVELPLLWWNRDWSLAGGRSKRKADFCVTGQTQREGWRRIMRVCTRVFAK